MWVCVRVCLYAQVACGDVEAEARMVHDLEAHDRAAILFPSTDAISVREWCDACDRM